MSSIQYEQAYERAWHEHRADWVRVCQKARGFKNRTARDERAEEAAWEEYWLPVVKKQAEKDCSTTPAIPGWYVSNINGDTITIQRDGT